MDRRCPCYVGVRDIEMSVLWSLYQVCGEGEGKTETSCRQKLSQDL